jgi:hypothetical protein
MALYRIQAPDGRTYRIEGPEGASDETVVAALLQSYPDAYTAPQVDRNKTGVGDLLTSFKQGAAGSARALANVAGADNQVSQSLGQYGQGLQQEFSPERQAELRAAAERMKAAEQSGSLLQEAKAGAMNVLEAPGQAVAQGLGSLAVYAPALVMGKVAAVAGLGARTVAALTNLAPKAMAALATAQGAGAVKGAIYDTVYENELAATGNEEAARAKAEKAQEYTGQNIDQILIGGGLGYVAGTSGVEKLLAGKGAQAMGQRVARAMAAEAATEAPQGAQEQLAANIAADRAGFRTPAMQGVVGAGVQEGLTGAFTAGPLAVFTPPREEAVAPPPEPPQEERLGSFEERYRDLTEAASDGALLRLEQRYNDYQEKVAELDAMRGTPGVEDAIAQLEADNAALVEEYEARIGDIERVSSRARAAKETPPTPSEPAPTPEPEPEVDETMQKLATTLAAIPLRVTPETVGKGTHNWMRTRAGGSFIYELAMLDPATAMESRDTIADTTNKRKIFDALFAGNQEPVDAGSDVRPGGETQQPVAEQVVGAPAAAAPEPGPAPADTAGVETPDGSGVDGGGNDAAEQPAATVAKPDPLTLQRLQERLELTNAALAGFPRRPRQTSPQYRVFQELTTLKAQLQDAAAGLGPVPPEVQADVEVPAEASAPAATEGELPGAGTAGPAVEAPGVTEEATAPVRDTTAIDLEIATLGASVRALESQREALRTSAGKVPAPNSPARKEYDALTAQIEETNRQGQQLLTEREAALAQPSTGPKKSAKARKVKGEAGRKRGDSSITEQDLLDALDAYNAPARNETVTARAEQDNRAILAAEFIVGTSKDPSETEAIRAFAQKLIDEELAPSDVARVMSGPVYRQGEAGAGMPAADVQTLWDAIAGDWSNKPEVVIVQSVRDLPIFLMRDLINQDRTAITPGAFARGKVYLIADNLASPEEVALTIAHEATGHYGLRAVLGDAYGATMQAIYDGNKAVRATADAKMAADARLTREIATEEVLADMQETGRELPPELQKRAPFYKRVLQLIKRAFARAFKQPVDSFTDAQVEQLLWEARTWVRRGKPAAMVWNNDTLFRTARAPDYASMVRKSEIMDGQPKSVQRAGVLINQAFGKVDNVGAGERFRVAVVDNAASVVEKLNAVFDGKVRTASGIVNPEILLRQAQDASQLLLPFVTEGSLEYVASDGMYRAVRTSGQKSMSDVLKRVEAWGKKRNKDFNTASAEISKMFEALRLDGLRTYNQTAAPAEKIALHKLVNNDSRSVDEQIDLALAQLAADSEAQAIKADLDSVKNHLINHMERVGRITAEDADAWRLALDYVPFDRVEQLEATKPFSVQRRTGKGLSQLGNLPELVGARTMEVGSVFDNSVRLHAWMISQTLRQDATAQTLQVLEAMGNAKFRGNNPNGVKDKSREVMTYRRGQRVYYEVDNRYMVLAFREVSEPRGAFVEFGQGFANLLRKTITALPPFAVLQLTKDIYRGFAQAGLKNPYAIVYPTLRNFLSIAGSELLGRKNPLLETINKRGVGGGYDIDLRNPSEGVLEDLGLRARGPLKAFVHRMDAVTRASDAALRLAIHQRTMAETGDAGLATARAREIINFRRRGAARVMPALVALIPFFNAYLQGMDVLYRQITGKGAGSMVARREARKMFMSRMMQMAALSMLYSFAVGGTEDYEELDELTRANNFIIPGTPIKIPVAGELGALFKVPVETAMAYYRRQGTPEEMEAKELVATVFHYAMEQFMGGGMPAVVKPLLEAITNYSFFTGRPLEGTYQKGMDKPERTNRQTSELAVAISKAGAELLGPDYTISPILIDNTLKGYFGSVAGTVTMATDQIINPDRLDRPMNKYWLLSVFMYDPEVKAARKNEAYNWNEKAAQRLATMRRLGDRDPDAALAYFEKYENDIIMGKTLEQVIRKSGELRRFINDVSTSPLYTKEYTKEQRDEMIKEAMAAEHMLFSEMRAVRNQIKGKI